jgi:hypothetical protein
MTETGSSQKTAWWREVLIAFVVAFVISISTYYRAKLSHAEQRAEQAEARLKQIGQQQQLSSVPAGNQVNDAPTNLVCPEGTSLRRVVSYEEFMRDSNARGTDWECIGKPRRVADR